MEESTTADRGMNDHSPDGHRDLHNFIHDPKKTVTTYLAGSLAPQDPGLPPKLNEHHQNPHLPQDQYPGYNSQEFQEPPQSHFIYAQPAPQRPPSAFNGNQTSHQLGPQIPEQYNGEGINSNLPFRPFSSNANGFNQNPLPYPGTVPPTQGSYPEISQQLPYQKTALATPSPNLTPYPPTPEDRPQSRIGPAPPPANIQNSTVSSSRTYHRLVTEYETLRYIYYAATINNKQPTELAPLVRSLLTVSRDIWNLRYTRSAEFAYSTTATEQLINGWKAQYEYWSDVLEDLSDPLFVVTQAAPSAAVQFAGLLGEDFEEEKPAVVKKKAVKKAAPAEEATADEAEAPVVKKKKKVVKKAAVAEEEDEEKRVVKKKKVKKAAAAAE